MYLFSIIYNFTATLNCLCHYQVFDGLNSYPFDGLIGWYCGGDIPHPILSASNIVYVEFLSDDDSVFTGFEIVYRHIPGKIRLVLLTLNQKYMIGLNSYSRQVSNY